MYRETRIGGLSAVGICRSSNVAELQFPASFTINHPGGGAECFSSVNIWREISNKDQEIYRSWKAHVPYSIAAVGFFIPIKITLPEPATESKLVVNQAYCST